MKKKGFTLIELLAVIVILAIIALIATPLVLKYIEKSRKESKVDSAYSYVRNLETEIANYSIKNNGKKYNKSGLVEIGDLTDIDTTVKGDTPSNGKVCLSSLGQVDKAILQYSKYYVSYDGKKGSISDKDTYDNFSCNGNVADGSDESIFEGNINFSEDTGYYGMMDSCLDPEKLISGEYYDIVLTDASGNSYAHRLLAQNQIFGVTSVDQKLPIVLSSPKEAIWYQYVESENMCYLANDFDSDGNPLYNGDYQMEVKATKQKTNPNYVFRISKYYRNDYYSTVNFYSSDLKVGDKVDIEVNDGEIKKFSGLIGENADETEKIIYSKQHFKFFSDSEQYLQIGVPADVKIFVNDNLIYEFEKNDFTSINNPNKETVGIGCVFATYYYVGNDDIDYVNGC